MVTKSGVAWVSLLLRSNFKFLPGESGPHSQPPTEALIPIKWRQYKDNPKTPKAKLEAVAALLSDPAAGHTTLCSQPDRE